MKPTACAQHKRAKVKQRIRLGTEIEKLNIRIRTESIFSSGRRVNRRQTCFIKQADETLLDEKYITSIFAFFFLFLSTSVSNFKYGGRHDMLNYGKTQDRCNRPGK